MFWVVLGVVQVLLLAAALWVCRMRRPPLFVPLGAAVVWAVETAILVAFAASVEESERVFVATIAVPLIAMLMAIYVGYLSWVFRRRGR